MEETMSEAIKPCPFCGEVCYASKAIGVHDHKVMCEEHEFCDYGSRRSSTEAEAIAAHNRVAGAVEEVAALRDGIEGVVRSNTELIEEVAALREKLAEQRTRAVIAVIHADAGDALLREIHGLAPLSKDHYQRIAAHLAKHGEVKP